jgi:peptidoglycan/LPS O-acetylase OafA/YrhL
MLGYRKEIDGLRALAIIPILLFHAGFKIFSGGFVGVDVFFVISGYLITTIIVKERQENSFSLLAFYERRVRRILPALFLMMALCIPLAWVCLLPNDMLQFSKSVKAVALFFSNYLFYKDSGYFDTSNELKPLLHTWSLAIEEQYYLFFPPLILFAWRFGKRWIIVILAAIANISFFLAEWGAYNKPFAAFFLLPARAWEFLLGAFIAFYILEYKNINVNASLKQVASSFGLLLIVYSVFSFEKNTPFPGVYALAPTFGAALIILFASPSTIVGAILSSPLFVGIGLISYSTYLWHQPLFVFARYASVSPIPDSGFAVLCLISLALGYLSWRFIERPFRSKSLGSRKSVFIFAVGFSLLFVVFGYVTQVSRGFDARFNKSLNGDVGHLEFHEYIDNKYYDCEPKTLASQALKWEDFLRCKQSKIGSPQLVLLGDSHAEHLFIGLAEARPELNIAFYILNGTPFVSNPQYTNIFNELLNNRLNQEVILTMHYVDRQNQSNYVLYDELGKTIIALQEAKKRIIIVGDVPRYSTDATSCVYRNRLNQSDKSCAMSKNDAAIQKNVYSNTLGRLAANFNVPYIDLHAPLCSSDSCSMINGDSILYRDNNHLNILGSRLVGIHLAKNLWP